MNKKNKTLSVAAAFLALVTIAGASTSVSADSPKTFIGPGWVLGMKGLGDADNDGLANQYEQAEDDDAELRTYPLDMSSEPEMGETDAQNSDTDGDCLGDGLEVYYSGNFEDGYNFSDDYATAMGWDKDTEPLIPETKDAQLAALLMADWDDDGWANWEETIYDGPGYHTSNPFDPEEMPKNVTHEELLAKAKTMECGLPGDVVNPHDGGGGSGSGGSGSGSGGTPTPHDGGGGSGSGGSGSGSGGTPTPHDGGGDDTPTPTGNGNPTPTSTGGGDDTPAPVKTTNPEVVNGPADANALGIMLTTAGSAAAALSYIIKRRK